MTALVPIEPGNWVLAYRDEYWPGHHDGDMARALEMLAGGGSGWDCLSRAEQQFEVVRVARVMPKTYTAVERDARRRNRELIIAASSAATAGEMLVLRDKLFTIGFAADRKVQDETERRMADFIAATRAEALAKVHAALPHIFGDLS